MQENIFHLKINNTIPLLDFSGMDLVEAHKQLAISVASQVHQIILYRIKGSGSTQATEFHKTAAIRLAGIEKIRKSGSTPAIIREALKQYLACLESWSQAADLASLNLPGVTPLELAIYLQDDHPGCQSGVYRQPAGSILFWHTEEDVDEPECVRVDQPRIMQFTTAFGGPDVYSFIYPDLLPGPNFNWRSDGFVQFADSLFFNGKGHTDGIAANLVTWITLMIGRMMPTEDIINSVIPVFEGYALFSAAPEHSNVICSRIEFTASEMQVSLLGNQPSAQLLQTNAFSVEAWEMAAKYERNPFLSRNKYESRVQRAHSCLEKISPLEMGLEQIQKMLSSRVGGRWAFANRDVKAHLMGRLSSDSLDIHCHPGTARMEN
jgi:hypothetical protein